MIANYHTHTPRCRHASGTEEEMVRAALEAGLKTLGFADHTPYPFPGNYYSSFRMYPDQLEDYAQSVLAVRKAYQGKIEIPLGLEAEYYPAFFPQMLSWARDAGIEYLLLGQHFAGNEIGEHYCGRPTADEAILEKYCRQTAEAMYTGLFSYLAHPDLICFTGEKAVYRRHMRHICRAANACGMPLEVNILGIFTGRNYPDPVFWEIAAEENCTVILGRDAHAPEQLLDKKCLAAAEQLIDRFGLKKVDTVQLRRI